MAAPLSFLSNSIVFRPIRRLVLYISVATSRLKFPLIRAVSFLPVFKTSNLLTYKHGHLLTFGFLSAVNKKMSQPDMKKIFEEADQMFEDVEYEKIIEILSPYKEGGDVEVMWRIVRAMYQIHKTVKGTVEQRNILDEGFGYLKKLMETNPDHPNVHKWLAIYMNSITKQDGARAQIEQSSTIKQHMLKACELGPKDPTNWHLIGMWCYTVADMSWTQRKLASIIFGEPPTSSYDEALKYLLEAEKAKPQFYSMNLLMIGKCYMKLKNKEEAVKFIQMTKDYIVKTLDDKEAHAEALSILKSLGIRS